MTAAIPPRTLADLIPLPIAGERPLVRRAVLVLGFALFTAALAQIRLTLGFTPVPITGQTLGVVLAGATLGVRDGAASQALYWLLGLIGLPFYAGGAGGWSDGTGVTFGYFVGFVAAAALVGALAERRHDRSLVASIPAMLAGSALIYVFGVAWLSHDLGVSVANSDPAILGGATGISLGLTPFLIGDLLKVLIAGALTPIAWRLARTGTGGGAADR